MFDYNKLGKQMGGYGQQLQGLESSCGFLGAILGGIGSLGASYGPDEDGWHAYIGDGPPRDKLLQFERRTETLQSIIPQTTRWVGYADFLPEFNVADLYWRLTGIAKESK